ncbi:armadillo-type protein [Sphaerosporella brunnea]|uniref:Armadillo-type protein n=1 Tax=Sphaerosporella brunnea TaxID=1250544 RepID=A0A5J5EZJ1_9PEZI|nr:armadillo-type protein [Sphaerosporella brunnea]
MSDIQEIFKPQGTPTVSSGRQTMFQELKPRCVALSRCILTSSKPNNRELTAALTELYSTLQNGVPHEELDIKLGDYIFFPLSHVFRRYRELNDRSIELALQCLEILIRTCWRVQIAQELGTQLLILLTFVVGGAPNQEGAATAPAESRSEETKLAGSRCLLHLFKSLTRSGGAVFEEVESIPALGHTVTTLLTTFAEAEMLELQLSALKAMEQLLLEAVRDEDMRASFYPGVVSGLVRALGLGKTTKRPYQVLSGMVKLLDSFISRVLDDAMAATLPETDDGGEMGKETLRLWRTKPWLKATAANTKVALEQVLKLRTHPRIEVRTAVFELARNLLETCSTSLDEAVMMLVETLVVIAGDEDESLASLAGNTIRVMAALGEKIQEAVRGCLDRWIVGLPRVMTGNDEDAKQRVITRLSVAFALCMELDMETGLLRDMLADGIRDSMLAVNASKRKPGTVLVQATPVRPRLEMVLKDPSGDVGGGGRIAKFPDVMMRQRSQMRTLDSMKHLLESLGQSSEQNGLRLAQRHLREAGARGLPVNERATSFWIAINLLRGSLNASNEVGMYLDFGIEMSPLQHHVIDEVFALALENLPTSVEDETEAAENAPIQCLAIEALSLVAETHKRQFRGDLVDALYPVVHHLGSSSPEVQNHAIVALNNIAHACEYPSAKELLLDNVDYMVNAVSLKLNIFDLSPQAPVVLNMMLKLVGPRLVPHLDDLVASIFSILDGFHEYERLCEELFLVLGVIVEESSKGDPDVKMLEAGKEKITTRRRPKPRLLKDHELVEFLQQFLDENRPRLEPLDEPMDDEEGEDLPKEFPRGPWGKGKGKGKAKEQDSNANPLLDEDMEDEDDGQHAPPPPEEEAPKPTKTYEIVQRITRLSQHYLTHGSFSMRARVLRLVSQATSTLGVNEREYLPVVNDIWPVVYTRLFDDEPGVVIQACQAIAGIAETSGDFLSTRVKEGWPGIRKVYAQAWRNLEKERRVKTANMGIYGVNYKVWDAVVVMLSALVKHAGVTDEIVDEICEMCGGEVLAERQDLKVALEEVAPDVVWLEVESWERTGKWEEKMPVLEGVAFVQPVF